MNEYIASIAVKAANREVAALTDYFKLGRMVVTEELTYDVARDELGAAFKERNMSAATAKVYLSQGFKVASTFESMADVRKYADDRCQGSRSLKRIYDAIVKDAKGEAEGDEGEADEAEAVTATALVDVILANLAHLTDRDEIKLVMDTAANMLSSL
jgi:hypothetical protein